MARPRFETLPGDVGGIVLELHPADHRVVHLGAVEEVVVQFGVDEPEAPVISASGLVTVMLARLPA